MTLNFLIVFLSSMGSNIRIDENSGSCSDYLMFLIVFICAVPISVVAAFKKIKALVHNNLQLAMALQTSTKLVSSYKAFV